MNDAFLDAIKEAFTLAPADKVIYHTLEINQPGVQGPIRLVQSRQTVVAADENGIYHPYDAVGFQFSLPPSNEEGFTSLNISIDNIDRRVSDFVETAKSHVAPVEVTYRPYLSDDLTTPQMIPPLKLYLKDIQVTQFQVTGRATFMDIVNKKFPNELYTRARFPALG